MPRFVHSYLVLLSLCLLLLPASICANAVAVIECRGAHGERVFLDRASCPDGAPASASFHFDLPATEPAAESEQPQQKSARSASAMSARSPRQRVAGETEQSFRCTQGGQTWYQHGPCRAVAAAKPTTGSKSSKTSRGAVTQTPVSRRSACREIARAGALLRRGSERDQRTEPYARATRGDPC